MCATPTTRLLITWAHAGMIMGQKQFFSDNCFHRLKPKRAMMLGNNNNNNNKNGSRTGTGTGTGSSDQQPQECHLPRIFPPKEIATRPDAWPPHNHQITYDWTKSTVQIYKAQDDDDDEETAASNRAISFPETFLTERRKLDYGYHYRLIYSRLIFQDSVIAQIKTKTSPPPPDPRRMHNDHHDCATSNLVVNNEEVDRPWLIFTAGPMGVGKGYVLAQLKQMQVLDASEFIIIDPDMIKTTLPEMAGYEYTSAATLLHAESSQMADVLLEHCLAHSYNMIVDGSLRDVAYYQQLIVRIRREFGTYRIAILHVTAHPDTIRERARMRSGRAVPEALVEESIRQVPESVHALTPFVDAVHVIRNEAGSTLKLETSILRKMDDDNDDTGTSSLLLETKFPSWEMFARSWKANYQSTTIPAVCKPLNIQMDDAYACVEAHDLANAIWKHAYPKFCARCTICSDRQCGICRHNRHRCGCHECASVMTIKC